MQNVRALKRKLEPVTRVRILVGGRVKEIDSDLLVPGDVLEIQSAALASSTSTTPSDEARGSGHGVENASGGSGSGWKIPCDAVLVSGTCIVNESILTGECAYVSVQYLYTT